MPEDVLICPLCGSGRSQFFDRREFRGQVVTNRLCQECGLVYQSPRMTEAESAAFYAEEYRLLYEGSSDPTARNVTVQRARAESLFTFARPVVEKVARHLDIGCSLGILLQRFTETYHCQPAGIEPGGAHRTHARKEGLAVYAALEELEKAGEARFDLVTMSHVLEHLADPVGYLSHLRESILAPDGWLLLEVPNLYAHDSFEVAHLYAFSPHILREVLCRSGFEIIKFEKHGRPNSAIFPLFLTALCRPAVQLDLQPVRPERGAALKRCIGMFRRRILARIFPQRAWLVRE
ncbi:MAG: class I SAM-dependent methyltransferase [Anaerolineales bacterium]|nr:class I SAM-dependent methyltransferase [Anaerolineales bacterium]